MRLSRRNAGLVLLSAGFALGGLARVAWPVQYLSCPGKIDCIASTPCKTGSQMEADIGCVPVGSASCTVCDGTGTNKMCVAGTKSRCYKNSAGTTTMPCGKEV